MIYVLSEALLYVCFALLTGACVLAIVPERKKPIIQMSDTILTWAVLGIVVLSSVQVIKLIIFFRVNLGYEIGYITFTVLSDYKIGNAWFVTIFAAMGILYFLGLKPDSKMLSYKWIGISVFNFFLVLAMGWASHSATVHEWIGFAAHTLHFLAAIVWIGVMLVIGWFVKEVVHWTAFLRWFTPLAIGCVLVTIAAGLLLMSKVTPNYLNSWISSYGQAMLIKHLLIVPILGLALLNTFLFRKVASNPLPWLKTEGIFVVVLFAVTAFMGQQSPVHEDLEEFIKEVGPSPLFLSVAGNDLKQVIPLSFSPDALSITLFLIAVLGLYIGLYMAWKKQRTLWSLAASAFFVVCGYLSLMFAVA
ncbi:MULTISPECIES: copper resistance D family protein [Paenibacillus]|uniref:copper resistance D family protein n=1 Tax=Paenibacillus TaxID=44249 RepID=UPI001141F5A5|nr:CopD family protein [Paenibacillus sp. tmac-D7]